MKNKYKLIALLISTLSFSNEKIKTDINLKTDLELSTKFSKRLEDNEKKISYSPIAFEKLGYKFNILDLDVKFKEIGLNIGTSLKSSRNNAKLNDWDEDVKNSFEPKKRNKNHDIMAKIYARYESPLFYGLKSKNDITYYIDNIFNSRIYDKDKDEIKDLEKKAEFIEEDGSKQVLGNILINSSLKGKIEKSDTELDLGIKYKANQLVRFDKDSSYIKSNFLIKQGIKDKLDILLEHKLDYDLYNSSIPFDTFDNELSEYPDYIVGNYLDFINQDARIELKGYLNKEKDEKEYINLISKVKVDSQLLKGENKKSKVTTPYHIIEPKLEFNLSKRIYDGIYISPKIENEFKIKYAKFYPETERQRYDEDIMAAYFPKAKLGIIYDKNIKEGQKIKTETGIGYGLSINIYPYFSETKKFKHNVIAYNKTNLEYKVNEKLNIKLDTDLSINTIFAKGWLMPASDKLDLDLNVEYKANEKITINGKLENKLSLTNKRKVLNPNNFKENFKGQIGLKYILFENKEKEIVQEEKEIEKEKELITGYKRVKKGKKYVKEPIKKKEKVKEKIKVDKIVYKDLKDKLTLEAKTYVEFMGEFDHYITAKQNAPKSIKTNLIYFGTSKPLVLTTNLGLNANLEYERNLTKKLNLKTGVNVDTRLDLLSLRSDKLYHYKKTEKDIPQDKEKPLIRDIRKTNYNVGGHLIIEPKLKLEYKLVENLSLNAQLKTKVKFEREVINIIKDKNRPDNGKYWYIDKKFGFKELVPTLKIGLEYKW